MQEHLWTIERLLNGRWYYFTAKTTRAGARRVAKELSAKTRIRKFIAA